MINPIQNRNFYYNTLSQPANCAEKKDLSNMQSCPDAEVLEASNNITKLTSNNKFLYEEYKNNPEFKHLQNSQYFNNPEGTENILNMIRDLEISKNQAKINNCYGRSFNYSLSKKIENLNITKCLYNINKIIYDDRINKQIKDYTIINANSPRFQILILDSVDNLLGGNDINKIEKTIISPLYQTYY